MASTNQTLGDIIQAARKEAGKTQKECAEAIEISTQSWSQIETNYRRLPEKYVQKVATFLAIDPDLLLTKRAKGVQQIQADQNKDILPLLRLIVECSCTSLTISDLEVLMDLQDKMPNPISSALITELLKNRHNK